MLKYNPVSYIWYSSVRCLIVFLFTVNCYPHKKESEGWLTLKICSLTSVGNPLVGIRGSHDRLILTMVFLMLVRRHGYIESGPWQLIEALTFSVPQIQSILLPVYLKPTVPKEVRMASFLVLMKTQPSSSLMQYLTHGLKKETSLEVLSFVYTYLETLSLTEDPTLYNV